MKKLNQMIIALLITLCYSIITAQEATQINLVSSVKAKSDFIVLNLGENVQTEAWDKNYIRVLMEVNASNINKSTLKRLVKNGRYKVATTTSNGVVTLSLPNLTKKVKVGKIFLKENINYTIFLPRNMNIQTKSTIPSNIVTADTEQQKNAFAKSKTLYQEF